MLVLFCLGVVVSLCLRSCVAFYFVALFPMNLDLMYHLLRPQPLQARVLVIGTGSVTCQLPTSLSQPKGHPSACVGTACLLMLFSCCF